MKSPSRARANLTVQVTGSAFILVVFSGCGQTQPASPGGDGSLIQYAPDGGSDGGDARNSGPAVVVYSPTDAGGVIPTPAPDAAAVMSIAAAPYKLIPSFSPDVQDYYIRCAAGENQVEVTVIDSTGSSTTTPAALVPDQAVVVDGQYWIRCLPPDFPAISAAFPSGAGPTPGYYLLNTAAYAIVLDTRATPVWYARGSNVVDVESQRQNTISLTPNDGVPYGTDSSTVFQLHALDSRTTTEVRAVGTPTDGHELRFLDNGDYLLLTYPTESDVDLSELASSFADDAMADCEIQEVDPKGNLVWSWLASDHIDPVTESLEPAVNYINGQEVVDVFHCNSIDVDAAGNLLLSVRYANAVYYIDRSSGQIRWKLGGTPTNRDGATYIQVVGDAEGSFNMQHDARLLANGDVTLFDDHGASAGVARGVEYALDMTAGTASVVWQFACSEPSLYEGSFRRYSDGESVIGWGADVPDLRVLTELDGYGEDVFDVTFTPEAVAYRAIKVPLAMLDIAMMRATAGLW